MSANNLPIQITSFVGRERELVELQRLLPTTRLLTLTGAGGVGKTRLALQVAATVLDGFNDGVWFIDLAPLLDPALVPITVASVLGVREEQGRPLMATIVEWLRPKHLLFLMDNCEHLLDACAGFANSVLRGGRETRILASSREALGIAGELAWRVPSLEIPRGRPKTQIQIPDASGQQSDMLSYASVRLFVERASFANAAFRLTEANAAAIAQICYRLDGIPLAIELAAARVKAMRVEQIAARLDDRFRLLTVGSRTALPRQQTLRGTIDWSHGLLTEPERVLLRRLSVFAGGWTPEAAEAVCAGVGGWATGDRRPTTKDAGSHAASEKQQPPWPVSRLPSSEVLDLLTRLVEKSLVLLDEQAAEPRYRMLETIRQYAHEQLLAAGESERLGDQHLAFFRELVERAEAHYRSGEHGPWILELESEHDNLRAALDWGCANELEAARLLAGQLCTCWYFGDHLNEARIWYGRVLRLGEGTAKTKGMALALFGAGWIAGYLLALDDAEPLLEQSVALWRELSDEGRLAEALLQLCFVKIHQGDSEAACILYEMNESVIRHFASPEYLAWALTWWGIAVATARADFTMARLLHEESLALGRKLKAPNPIYIANGNLAKLATQQGDYYLARRYMQEALTWSRQVGSRGTLAIALGQDADVAYLQAELAEAHKSYDEALATLRDIGDQTHSAHIAIGLGYIAIQQRELKQASAIFADCLAISRYGQFELGLARCLAGYAELSLAEERVEQAVRLLASEVVFSHSRTSHIPIDHIRYERTLTTARAQLGEAAFNTACEAGRRLTREQAIAEAEQAAGIPNTGSKPLPPPRDPNALTVREREVLRLVATGLSDAQIAAQLVISRRTVQTHLTSIFGKFGVNSRSAAAHHALSHKLL